MDPDVETRNQKPEGVSASFLVSGFWFLVYVKCAGAPSDAPARGLLHQPVRRYFDGVAGDVVTGVGSVGTGAGAGAGWDLAFRVRPSARRMSATCGARSAVSGRLARAFARA